MAYWAALQGASQMFKFAAISPEVVELMPLGREIAESLLIGWGAEPLAVRKARKRLEKKNA